jgi:hypothetical protein
VTWTNFYLICFLVGFVLSILSFAMGMLGAFHLHLHLPGHMHLGDLSVGKFAPKMGGGHPVAHGVHGMKAGAAAKAAPGQGNAGLHWFNYFTVVAFLTCFGATGYILTKHGFLGAIVAGLALLSGFIGAVLVFAFFVKVLLPHDRPLDPADFEMVGVIGRVTIPIREQGTGEIIFSQGGTRRSAGARAETGEVIPKQAEVVVTRYEKGIAYVQKWEDFANKEEA